MKNSDLKGTLHEMIQNESNEEVLQQIKKMLNSHYHTPLDELGGQTIWDYNKEMEDAEAGETTTQEELLIKVTKMFQ